MTNSQLLRTEEDMIKFFKLYKCRVKIITEIGRVIFKVPKKNYHFIRWYAYMNCPMGVFVEVENLKFYECRIKRIIIERRDSTWI